MGTKPDQTPRAWLARKVQAGGMVVAPGVYDALMARLGARAGFRALYMTGAGTAVSHGFPDYGLLTMTEMVANAARIARAAPGVALIADADTGFGNELNVTRTVREFEHAGAAAIHIEDQAFPKRCGHLDDKVVVPLEEYLPKIRAAAAARSDRNFLIIARTDARAPLGFEEAVRRMNAALEAGADMAFLEAPQSIEEIRAVPRLVRGPCLFNLVFGGRTPPVALAEIEAVGYRLVILPDILWRENVMAMERVLGGLAAGRLPDQRTGPTVRELFARAGAEEWDALRTRFAGNGAEAAE